MISLVVPTRKRPARFKTFMDSCLHLADNPKDLEILVYIDDDDSKTRPAVEAYHEDCTIKIYSGPRLRSLMKLQNYLYEQSSGEFIGYLADDVRFLTQGWDTEVSNAFEGDLIWQVCPREVHKGCRTAPHAFLSRRAIEIVGEFVPACFLSMYSDQWIYEVYRAIGRFKCLKSVNISHDHPGFSTRRKNPDARLAKYQDKVYAEKSTDRRIRKDKHNFEKYADKRKEWISKLRIHLWSSP